MCPSARCWSSHSRRAAGQDRRSPKFHPASDDKTQITRDSSARVHLAALLVDALKDFGVRTTRRIEGPSTLRFFRHGGIYRSDVVLQLLKAGAGVPPFRWSARAQLLKDGHGRNAPHPSSAKSSGRLFLDRLARQHSPSRFTGTSGITRTPQTSRQRGHFLLCWDGTFLL
jgi:hypothetical protein